MGALRAERDAERERADRAERQVAVLRAKLIAARLAGETARAEMVDLRDYATAVLKGRVRRGWLPWGRPWRPPGPSTTAGIGEKFVVSNGFGGLAVDGGDASATRRVRPRGQAAGPRPAARAGVALPAR